MGPFKNLLSFISERTFAYLLAVLTPVITFLPLANHLGYYDDDWFAVWGGFTHGAKMIAEMHSFDRPFSGLVYGLHYDLLGNTPLAWQYYMNFLRIIGAVSMLWTLRKIWPDHKLATLACTILAVVYPGFIMQPDAHTFSNHYFGYTSALISIAFSIGALYQERKIIKVIQIVVALVFGSLNLLMLEYMIGLEGMRMLLMWFVISQQEAKNLWEQFLRFLRVGWVYLIPLILFLYWRLFLFESGRRPHDVGLLVTGYLGSPLRTIFTKAVSLIQDFFEAVFASWFVHAYSLLREATLSELLTGTVWSVAGIGLFLIYFWLYKNGQASEELKNQTWGKQAMWLGFFSIMATLLPVTLAGREIILSHSFTRYAIHTAFAIGLFIMGGIYFMVRSPFRPWIFVFLLGLSIMTQNQLAVVFRQDWEHQRDLWWQFTWRVPDLTPDTALVIVPSEKTSYTEGYEIWGPANIIYNPEGEVIIQGQVLSDDVLWRILRRTTDSQTVRGMVFLKRDYEKLLLAAYTNSISCLHVIDGQQIELGRDAPDSVFRAAPYSDSNRILVSGTPHGPPAEIFGKEPAHTWCYFYQKISLARQRGDWTLAASLADEAITNDYKPLEISEWLPVLESYANTRREKDAAEIAKILRDDKELHAFLCTQLENSAFVGNNAKSLTHEILCQK